MSKELRFAIVAMACWMGLSGSPSRAATDAQAEACGPDVIPVVLTGEPEAAEFPQPVCSKCKRLTVTRQTSSTGETRGVLGLTYFDEVYPKFDGAIVLTLLMSDDSERVVTIGDVQLEAGEQARWLVADSQVSWPHVDMVWLEFLPSE